MTEATTYTAQLLDFDRLERDVGRLHDQYVAAQPFPHIVLEDLVAPDVAIQAIAEFPPLNTAEWNNYIHANERKFGNTHPETWGTTLRAALEAFQSDRFVKFLSSLTGIDHLQIDDSLEGGGLHQSVVGGFLNIHADFTVHPQHRDWRRRVNVLWYLNEDWRPEYGGDLELWSTNMERCEQKIAPVGNRVVIFTTDENSFHGHPEPLRCPPGVARQSMALYYFTVEDRPRIRSTEYRARPEDGVRSIFIFLDKEILRTYDWAKRRLGLSDKAASRLLNRVDRVRNRRR